MRYLLSVFALVLLFLNQVDAQFSNYASWQLTINEGLAHNTVECIFKDSEGFVWFGTHNGLNRFDGYAIKTYQNNPLDSNSISGNRVVAINEDSEGNLWIGTTRNGLNIFDKKTERFLNYKSGKGTSNLPSNEIHNIQIYDNDEIWLCTGNGVSLYNKQNDQFINFFPDYREVEGLPFVVYDLIKTRDGKIYLASSIDFIYELDPRNGEFTVITYSRDQKLRGNYRKHLAEDGDGNLWISAFSHGLIRLNPHTGESKLFTPKNSELNSSLLNGKFTISADNKLWLTSDGEGVIIYDLNTEKFSNITTNLKERTHLFDNKVYSLLVDNDGIVWVGTFNAGVNVLDPHQLKFNLLESVNEPNNLFNGVSILSIYEDSKANIWIGTDGNGLYQYTNEGFLKHYQSDANNSNSLSSDRIVCIGEDNSGNILLGSYMGGLVSFNVEMNKFTRYLPVIGDENSIGSEHVWEIFKDSEKRIWLGLLGSGLDLFDDEKGTFIHYGPHSDNYNRINHDNVMSIIEDGDGDLWFGTEGRGINILNKKTRRMYFASDFEKLKLANSNIRCVFEDSRGLIWIGAGNGGLNCYNKKTDKLKTYLKSNGLNSNIIESIVEDKNGYLWLGTAYGISKFDTEKEQFFNYDIDDGLMGYVSNRNSLWLKSDGQILVGTTKGLNVFHPDSIQTISKIPHVFFTDLRIQNNLVEIGDSVNGRVVLTNGLDYTEKLIISPKDKIFTLEFAAKTYTLPNKCKFQYKLEGFEKHWKYTLSGRQHVTYSNLAPGNYVFKIKAANSDGVWSDEITSLNITVLPTFWRTIWFKLIVLVLLGFVFSAWFKYKLGKKEVQFKKEKQVQHQKIIQLEKDNLEAELNNQTFNILSRNRTLLKHRRRLSTLLTKVDAKTSATLGEIIQEIDQEISEEKDWKKIEPRLDKVYNNFMTGLKKQHEDLTQNDLRIAAYVRMGLSTKEMSDLFQKTTKAIDNDRYRLRKKLNLQQNESLKTYLLELEKQ